MDNMPLKMDEYRTVLNGEQTYKGIASLITFSQPLCIAWTDENGTQYDILFSLPVMVGPVQCGIRTGDLFVAVRGFGCFAFDVKNEDLHPSYVREKLQMPRSECTDKLTELISGVRKKLAKPH